MTVSLQFYQDAALTTPITTLSVTQNADGSTGPVDNVVYLGSTATSHKFEAASNPGVANIQVSVADSNTSSGAPASDVTLALSQAALATNTPGAALTIGTQILSGSSNAVPVYVRVQDSTGTVGTYTDLSLTTNQVEESAV